MTEIVWTTKRPASGKWWLSVHPERRDTFGRKATWPQPVEFAQPGHEYAGSMRLFDSHFNLSTPMVAYILDGAMWAERCEPTDPFATKPAARRSIRLRLATDTTVTECGSCGHEANGVCQVFASLLCMRWNKHGLQYARLPECLLAEASQ